MIRLLVSCRACSIAMALLLAVPAVLLAVPAMAQEEPAKPAPVATDANEPQAAEGDAKATAPGEAKGIESGEAKAMNKIGGPVATPDETVHDFGEVWSDKSVKHTFKIKNTGDELLKIVSVKPGCGCTKAGPHPNQLAPDEEGEFSFQLNTAKLHGKFTKPITVTTNQRGNTALKLTLTGNIKHFVEVQPRIVQFGKVEEDTTSTKKVTVTNNTDQPMSLSIDPTSTSDTFKAEVAEVTPGKEFEISVTAQPPYQQNMNRHTIKLKTNMEQQDVVDVVCMATYPPRLEVTPDSISLRKVATESKRKLRFNVNGEKAVNLVGAESLDGKLTVEYRAIEDGRKYDLTVTVPPDYEPPATGTAIVLKTDDEKMKELRVPIHNLPAPTERTSRERTRPAETLAGKPAPVRDFKTVDGADMRIGGESENVKVVAFYASWCGFCKRSLPWIQEYYNESKDKNVDVILINTDDRGDGRRARTEEQSLEHYRSLELSVPMHLDSDKSITPAYKVTSYPTLFVVGKDGKVEDVIFGAKADLKDMLRKDVEQLLAGKSLQEASVPDNKIDAAGNAGTPVKPASAKALEIKSADTKDKAADEAAKKGDDEGSKNDSDS